MVSSTKISAMAQANTLGLMAALTMVLGKMESAPVLASLCTLTIASMRAHSGTISKMVKASSSLPMEVATLATGRMT